MTYFAHLSTSQSYIRMAILNTQSKKQPISEASTFEDFDLWKLRLFVSAALLVPDASGSIHFFGWTPNTTALPGSGPNE